MLELQHLSPGELVFTQRFGGPVYTLTNPEVVRQSGIYPVEIDAARNATIKWEPITYTEENASKVWGFLQRGGIAVWQSQAVESMGRTQETSYKLADGTLTPKPHWQYGDKPIRVISDPKEVLIVVAEPGEVVPMRRDGNLAMQSRNKFNALPPRSYWISEPGTYNKARLMKAVWVVPIDEYVERLVDGKFVLRTGDQFKYTPRR
jgi:hypothetical protein